MLCEELYYFLHSDVDFYFLSGLTPFNVTFNPMDTRRAIILNITDDQFAEGNELIILQLMNFSSVITFGQQTTMITIQENDGESLYVLHNGRVIADFLSENWYNYDVPTCFVPSPEVTVGFSSRMYMVVESGGYVEVCVQTSSSSDILSSGGFVTFSVSVTASTAGERQLLTQIHH